MKIFGHRGAAGVTMENTLASIETALQAGVDGIEIDVWLTADQRPVVFHDEYFDRLSNATGFVYDKDFVFVQNVQLNGGHNIPTLQEVVALIKPHKIPLLVEAKSEEAVPVIAKQLRENLDHPFYIIGSFFHEPIAQLKKDAPTVQTAIMMECVPLDIDTYIESTKADYIIVSVETFNEPLVNAVYRRGKQLLFYTVNEDIEYELALKGRAHGIITNFPARFIGRK